MQNPDTQPAISTQPQASPLRRLKRQADASLSGPTAPDVAADAGSSSLAIDREGALEQAMKDDILFVRGGEIGRLGSLSVQAKLEGQNNTPTLKAARLRPSAQAPDASGAAEAPVVARVS